MAGHWPLSLDESLSGDPEARIARRTGFDILVRKRRADDMGQRSRGDGGRDRRLALVGERTGHRFLTRMSKFVGRAMRASGSLDKHSSKESGECPATRSFLNEAS